MHYPVSELARVITREFRLHGLQLLNKWICIAYKYEVVELDDLNGVDFADCTVPRIHGFSLPVFLQQTLLLMSQTLS